MLANCFVLHVDTFLVNLHLHHDYLCMSMAFFFAELNGASQCCGFLAFLASFFLSQLQSFTDEPTLLHSRSYNHIAYSARGKLVHLRQFDVCVASFPHLSPTVLSASSYFFFYQKCQVLMAVLVKPFFR